MKATSLFGSTIRGAALTARSRIQMVVEMDLMAAVALLTEVGVSHGNGFVGVFQVRSPSSSPPGPPHSSSSRGTTPTLASSRVGVPLSCRRHRRTGAQLLSLRVRWVSTGCEQRILPKRASRCVENASCTCVFYGNCSCAPPCYAGSSQETMPLCGPSRYGSITAMAGPGGPRVQ